jgi:Xaa-Pro aminopeptidase
MLLPSVEERISPQEMKRRHDAVKATMSEKGYDAILVSGQGDWSSKGNLRYLTNWNQVQYEEYFLLPLKGESIYFSRYVNRANVQKKLHKLNAVFPVFGAGLKEGQKATRSGSLTSKIPPSFVSSAIKDAGIKSLGLCGPENMSGDFYVELMEQLNEAGIKFETASEILYQTRMIKSEEEQKWIRKTAERTCIAFHAFTGLVGVGKQEHAIYAEIDALQQKMGCEASFFTLASGHEPLQKYRDLAFRVYEPNDLIFFNTEAIGPGGYFTQLSRTLIIGKPDDEVKKCYDAVIEAENAAEKMLVPGKRSCDAFNAIKEVGDKYGYKLSQHPGHGQGLDMFEPPIISAYETQEFKAGMFIILHPRFQTESGRKLWIGDAYLIHESGPERLTTVTKELTEIDP